jgi:ligand-binding sensor domain-containing protein/anti-sigma regulatory factor (Ser/Thr protein kinase)
MMKMRRWAPAALVLIFLALTARAYALDPSRTLTQYVHRIWQLQNGLPQAWIYSIVQTQDGYLWLGTQTGLVKFDGARFTTVQQLAGVSNANLWVTHLIEDHAGALWIGTTQNGLLRLQGADVTRYTQAEGLPAGPVQCLFDDTEGNVWVCTPNGLAEITQGKVRVFGQAEGLSGRDVHAACVAPDGRLVASAAGPAQLGTLNSASPADAPRFESRALAVPSSTVVQTMLCASDGTVWIGTSDGLLRVKGAVETRLTTADGLADSSILTLMQTKDGSVLAGTKNGFSRIRASEIDSFRPSDGLSQSTVYSLFEDREGSLWVATKHGLNQFVDARGISYTTSEGLPTNNTGPVLQDSAGVVWVGTLGGGLARFDGHRFATTLTTRDGLTSNRITTLAEDSAGDLWVGTDGGLNRLRKGRVTGTWTAGRGLPSNQVLALYRDQAGTIWIATSAGPAVVRDGAVHATADRRRAATEPIVAFGEDRGHRLYAAPDSGSPLLNHADALYRDSEGLLWVGTLGDGLRLIDGEQTFSFSVVDGLFDDVIYGITEDDQGRLWMACSKGVFSVKRSDLRQFAAAKIARFVSTPYSPMEALRTVEGQSGVQPAVARMSDGRLWFSTIRGALVIDPNRFDRRLLLPEVTVEDVVVNGARRRSENIGTLPAGLNNVEFKYTGANFITPSRISFRYRLEGLDTAWVEAGSRREAFYSNLPPGQFRFRVAACNPDNECNESPDVVAFSIAPRLYQRGWFFPLCAVGIALAGGAMYQLRIRRLKDQFDLILAERGRIARELHDTIIQGFSGITMAMQAMVSRLPSSGERQTLEGIVADAGDAMRDARRSLAGLRRHDDASGLAPAIARAARQLTESNDVELKLSLGETRCELPADVEYNLLRIAQEAVLNAVKHSGARSLKVTLNSSPERLELVVTDDGAGFDGGGAPPVGHYGLIGMKERATQIGADLTITSTPGSGTNVVVVMEP